MTTSRVAQLRMLARLRKVLAGRDRLDRAGDEARAAWCSARLAELRRHAIERSPHYREAHRGLEDAPLDQLPVVTKADVVDRFDEMVTDPRLRARHLREAIEPADGPHRALGRYRVAMSSGSSGRPGLFAFDEREWVSLLAAAARARGIAGPSAAPGTVRAAKVGSPALSHLSRQLSGTLRDPRKPSVDLSAADDLTDICTALQRARPDVLSGYASVLAALAAEQIEGRLDIRPAQVFSGGEVLTSAARAIVRDAWGTEPFDQYLTTEAGFVAMECPAHEGLHILDDHVIVEVVDEAGNTVPEGGQGARVLLTVLSSRTIPLIRYQLDDLVVRADGQCACGRRSPRLASIAGGARDLLRFQGRSGPEVAVHPVTLTSLLDGEAVRAWQVELDPANLLLRVVGPQPSFSAERVADAIRASIARAGAVAPAVQVEVVDQLARSASGKASLIVSRPAAPSPRGLEDR